MPTEVIVAIVAAFGTVTAGFVGAVAAVKANGHSREARDIVRGNGMGDVAHMMESVLTRMDLHDIRHYADDQAFLELSRLIRSSYLAK